MNFENYLYHQLEKYHLGNFDNNIYILSSLDEVEILKSKLKKNEDLSYIFTWLQFHPINKYIRLITDSLFNYYFEHYYENNDHIPLSRALKRFAGFPYYETKLLEIIKKGTTDEIFNSIFDEFDQLDRIYIHHFQSLGATAIAWVKSIGGTYDLDFQIPNINKLNDEYENLLSLNMHLNLIKQRVISLLLTFDKIEFNKRIFSRFEALINRNIKCLDKIEKDKINEFFAKHNQKIEFKINLRLSYLLDAIHLLVVINNENAVKGQMLENLELIFQNMEDSNRIHTSFETHESLLVNVEISIDNNIAIGAKVNYVAKLTNEVCRQLFK